MSRSSTRVLRAAVVIAVILALGAIVGLVLTSLWLGLVLGVVISLVWLLGFESRQGSRERGEDGGVYGDDDGAEL